ncbi:type II toxin-antitoxin system VapB family antitoxin [Methylopila musalis]|uniref:Type II toxin-antitoxin system VapB family antitoxin n=1 Tax=Methylopila musalis TaxID=1134781 RepID=A0ABW3Z6Y5_9HYPH
MAFHVRDPETDRVVRELAAAKGTSLTETIRAACEAELKAFDPAGRKADLRERLRPIWEEMKKHPSTGLAADKAFYDSLNDE